MTVHSVATPDLSHPLEIERSRTLRGRMRMLLVLLVCAAPVVASYVTYYVIRPEGRTNYGELIVPTRSLPALALRTLDGAAVAAPSLRGQWLLVVVAPARCDEPCQDLLFVQRQLREMLGRDRDRIDKVWFVTGDGPVAAPLRSAIEAAPATTALRVDRGELSRWLTPADGHALEDHLYVVDPMGEWMMRMPAQAEPSRVKRDLERLLRASASWDNAGR